MIFSSSWAIVMIFCPSSPSCVVNNCLVNTLQSTFSIRSPWKFIRTFVDHIDSKTRSLGQIERKHFQHSWDCIFYFSSLRLCHVFCIRNLVASWPSCFIFSSPMHEVQVELLWSHFVWRPFVVRRLSSVVRRASSTFALVNTLQATFCT